jgi:hypothetical protein
VPTRATRPTARCSTTPSKARRAGIQARTVLAARGCDQHRRGRARSAWHPRPGDAAVVLYHHERFDGTGYPAGLCAQDIPLAARALAVLEAYGAMTHERPEREPWSPKQACEALIDAAGTQFDPEIAQLFVEQVRRAPRLVRDDVSAAVLDALPLEAGELVAAAVDGATLLGNHQRLQQDISAAAKHDTPFGVVVLELIDLPASTPSGVISPATS